jgi:PilZ domain-containing protein
MIERRALPRYELSFPICVGVPTLKSGSGHLGRTRDISTRGVHFILKRALAPGDAIAFVITLPAELIGRAHVFVRCHGTVLWVDGCHETGFGIAAAIESYKISKDRR